MKREVWLRTNRRVLVASALLPVLGVVVAAAAFFYFSNPAVRIICGVVGVVSLVVLGKLLARARRPRIGYRDGALELFLTGRSPIILPVDIVECFFLGQGPSRLPNLPGPQGGNDLETATLVIRLAEAAVEWKHRDVDPWLGQWCEGYITIRGTFCEPLSKELAGGLNRRLVEAHRELRNSSAKEVKDQ